MNTPLRDARRQAGNCIDCKDPTPAIPGKGRCAAHAEARRVYMQAYHRGERRDPAKRPPPPGKSCERCGSPCRNRFCSGDCYRLSEASAASMKHAREVQAKQRHRGYDLGTSNRNYARRQLCPCSRCKAARTQDPAVHAELVAKVAREMGVPVSPKTGVTHQPLTREEFQAHWDKVNTAKRIERGTDVWAARG